MVPLLVVCLSALHNDSEARPYAEFALYPERCMDLFSQIRLERWRDCANATECRCSV